MSCVCSKAKRGEDDEKNILGNSIAGNAYGADLNGAGYPPLYQDQLHVTRARAPGVA
jgi:hypothetical protein